MIEFFQNIWLVLYLFALVTLFTYGMNCYLLMFFYRLNRSRWIRRHSEINEDFYRTCPPKDWPRVTIQLPIFNERYVAGRLIRAVSRFQYPNDLLEIQILDDSTDDTAQIASRLADNLKEKGLDIEYIHRDNRDGFKAGALKEGLTTAKGDLLVIFDADF